MKRKLISVAAVILSLFFALSVFSGCDLVTTDNERDMNQVVATVKISDAAGARKDEIKKRDMVMLYLNYGYYYVNQMGYTNEKTFNLILDNLIRSKIILQTALIDDGAETSGIWDAEEHLGEDQKIEALYNTIKTMNEFIDRYEEEEDEKKYETFSGEVRTVPSDAANADEDLSSDEMKEYNEKYAEYGADRGTVGSGRYKAYNKVLKYLDNNGLLGEDAETLKDSEYFKNTLISNQENQLIEEYEEKVQNSAREKVTFKELETEYAKMYEAQKNSIVDVAAFEQALSSATAANPLVYTPYTGYIYVYNLLLSANDNQTALIGKLDKDALTDAEYYAARNEILSSITIKDLRSSWILSGYDFDFATGKFTGDYAFLEDSVPFKGTVEQVNTDKTEDEDAVYRITDIIEYSLESFIEFMDEYVYGASKTGEGGSYGDYIYKVVNSSSAQEDYDARINELLFAFSGDPGSLNTYKGYLISPEPEIGGSETYVKEFANAGRLFLTENLGGKSYVVVATDYGYHVMFFSQALGADSDFDNLVDYLNYAMGQSYTEDEWAEKLSDLVKKWNDKDTDTSTYLYRLVNLYSNASTVLSDLETSVVNKYKNDSDHVVKYTSRYQDLLNM